MGLPLLIAHGTADQQDRFLRRCFTGAEIWCQLFSEPGAGSDVASLSTRAVRQPDGGWRVDGQKVWSSLAHKASVGMLLARCDPNSPKHEGLVVLLVDMTAPGVTVRPLREITGEAVFNEVFFSSVDVPDDRRIGAPGEGWQVARTILTNERVMLSGAGAGTGPDVVGGSRIEKLIDRAHANGSWEDPLVRDELVRRFIEGQLIRQTNIRSRQRGTRGLPPLHGAVTKLSQGLYNRRLQATALRVEGQAATAWRSADGAGTASGYLRAQANTIEGGTPEMLRNTIGERLLGLPRDEGPARNTPWSQLRKN
jgi:alkylation response protein AidB-like acyl-CoA dehydrogenase